MYRYLVLGLLQGLTEFLPVSSSGHLVLAQRLLGLDPPGVVLEAVLHLGTLAAVVIYFWRDLVGLLRRGASPAGVGERRYIALLILGTVPIVVAGYLAGGAVEQAFSSPALVGGMLLVTAALLGGASLLAGRARRDRVGLGDALAVGLAQVAALLPGISRSGATISVGMACGLSPREAARFSFLLSIPAVAGAGVLGLVTESPLPPSEAWGLLLGGLSAMASGLIAIHTLLKLLLAGKLRIFAFYCLIAGSVTLGVGLLS